MRSTKATKQSKSPMPSGTRGMTTGALQSIMRPAKDDVQAQGFDVDLFNSLLAGGKRAADHESDSFKSNQTRNVSTLKNRNFNHEKIVMLQEELENERQKVDSLEEEMEELEEKLENNKDEYKRNLEIFSGQIKNYKSLHNELLKQKEEGESREIEIKELRLELEKFKRAAKSTLEFVIKAFEIVTLLPEQVEVDSKSRNIMEFSFEEKRAAFMPKTIFLENKIVKFLETNETLLTHFKLEGLLLKIIEEYDNKKNHPDHFTSPKIKHSSSKKKKNRDQKTSPKSRSPKIKKHPDSFSGIDQSSFDKSGEMQTDKGLESSHSKSFQNSSGGKSNNYSININLVVNDNSDSMISDQNQSVAGVSSLREKDFFKFFEKELGCDINKSDSSIVINDSLMYSPSNKSSRLLDNSASVAEIGNNSRHNQVYERGEYVKAMFRYKKTKQGDIELEPGDKIKVSEKSGDGWWIGQNLTTGKYGSFPSNFTTSL